MTVMIALFTIIFFQGCVVNSYMDYSELYKNIEYQSRLPNLIANCLSGLDYESRNKTECDVAHYISRISTAYKYIVSVIVPGKPLTIISTREFVSYQTVFYDYVAVGRPMKGSNEVTQRYTSEEVALMCGQGLSVSLIECLNENKV